MPTRHEFRSTVTPNAALSVKVDVELRTGREYPYATPEQLAWQWEVRDVVAGATVAAGEVTVAEAGGIAEAQQAAEGRAAEALEAASAAEVERLAPEV
jgi:hypothetical protein